MSDLNLGSTSRAFGVTQMTNDASGSTVGNMNSLFITRTSATVLKYFENTTQLGPTKTTSDTGSLPSLKMYWGATNNSGVAAGFTPMTIQGCGITEGLSDAEWTAFRNLCNALNAAIPGRT